MTLTTRKTVAAGGIAALAALAAGGGVGHASTGRTAACAVPSQYATIQLAVDAPGCGTIKVAPGTYAGNVAITRSLKLLGARSGQDARSRPGGSESVVTGDALATITITADDVTVDGFTLNGPSDPGTAALVLPTGNSGQTIRNNVINNPGRAASITTSRTTFARNLVRNTTTAQDGFQATSMPVQDVTITHNTFTGPAAPNYNADVTFVQGNRNLTVTGNRSTGNGTLVALFKTAGAKIAGNTVAGTVNSSAIYLGGGNSNVTVKGNTVSGARSAVRIDDSFGAGANAGITVTRNTLKQNQYGVSVGAASASGTLAVNRNRLVDNAAYGVFNDPASGATVDATCNWWGSPTGPIFVPGPDPTGLPPGEKVSTEVTYQPWRKLSSLHPDCPESGR